jgi:ligand-binding sensor domain-containing protein
VAADGQTVVVSRLDGQRFTRLYESKVAIPEGRAEVRFARVAPDGKLWAGPSYVDRDGIGHPWGVAILAAGEPARYHRSSLMPAEDRQPGSLALPDDIRDVLFAGEDTWFSTGSGICRVRGSKVDVFTENEGLESEIVYSVAHGPGGQLFAASHGGVGRFDGKWWHFDLGDVLRKPSRALVPRGQHLWVGTSSGLVGWSPSGLRVIDSRLGLAGDRVLDLYLEAGRRMWVLTDDGLSIVNL